VTPDEFKDYWTTSPCSLCFALFVWPLHVVVTRAVEPQHVVRKVAST